MKPVALLNCFTKEITFSIENETFKVDLDCEEKDLDVPKVDGKMYALNFHWEDRIPVFKATPLEPDSDMTGIWYRRVPSQAIEFTVSINKGCYEDFNGKVFPNGYQSWVDTFFLMSREIDGIEGYNRVVSERGSTFFFDVVDKWADEFETLHSDTEWDGEYEDQVVYFLRDKIKQLNT